MSRERIGQLLFLVAVALAAALYVLTAPSGLPWNGSTRLAEKCLEGSGGLEGLGVWRVWGFHVRAVGGAVELAILSAALAAGLLAALVNRYFGWRFASASALVWIFLPGVWNRAITGERGVCLAAAAVLALWVLNAVVLAVTRKGRAVREAAQKRDGAASVGNRLGRVNRMAGWVALGAAGAFAVVSLSMHDYRLGEAASAYARGVVAAAGENNRIIEYSIIRMPERSERIIVMNGVCDEQVEREVRRKQQEGRSEEVLRFVSLREDEWNRVKLVAAVKREWPDETNLWMAAQVGATAFLNEAEKAHPERFYLMNGTSATLEQWERRWADFKPYAESSDPFAPVGRRIFGCEGNNIANAMQDEGESAKAAWQLYKRVYEEVDPGNISALVNMSEMIRRGYAVGSVEKKAVQERMDAFFSDPKKRKFAREIARSAGPVRTDEALVAKMAEEAKKRIAARIAAGEKVELQPEVLSLVEWNNEMCELMDAGELAKAGRIARKILSNPKWQSFLAANAVMGAVLSCEGDYAASEQFFKVALDTTNAVPAVVLNDYADTLVHLARLDEAEALARRAVAGSDESFWLARLTLAEILEKKSGKLVLADVVENGEKVERYVRVDGADKMEDEVRALLKSVMKYAPAAACDKIRQDHRRFVR